MPGIVLAGHLFLGGTGSDDLTGDLDVTAECTGFIIKAAVNTIEVPATLSTPIHGRGGAVDYSLQIDYLACDVAGTLFRKLYAGLGGTLTFSGRLRTGAIGATNPEWYGTIVVLEASLGGMASAISEGSAVFPMTTVPTRATS